MRLFLDQMCRVELAEELQKLGHDVFRACDSGLDRADDAEILAQATGQKRVLITLDRHFGDWAVLPLREHCGVIRVKVHPTTVGNMLAILKPMLASGTDEMFANRLVIASATRVRWIVTGD